MRWVQASATRRWLASAELSKRPERAPTPRIGGVVAYRYILGKAGPACHASGMIAVVIDDQKRSAVMKTSLAIVLATIALTFGAMLNFTSGVAAQTYGNLSGKSPGVSPV